MHSNSNYLFTSERLGFRSWSDDDLEPMTLINNDPDVMEYFPKLQDREGTYTFIKKMYTQFEANQFCYFAVELLETGDFLGFIGMSNQDHGLDKGDFVDIGWRLKKSVWGKGLATEGAKACLNYASTTLGITDIYAIATTINIPSIRVMEKIGMNLKESFDHPRLIDHPKLVECVLYHINL